MEGLPSRTPAWLLSTSQPTSTPARRAFAASGSVCTMSPIAERRTIKTFMSRNSGLGTGDSIFLNRRASSRVTSARVPSPESRVPDPFDQIRRRMVLRITDDHGAAAIGRDRGSFGHGLGGVVGSLGVDVGPQSPDETRGRILAEDDDGIHAAQRGH